MGPSLSCGLSFFIWQLDPQSEKVEAANPLKTEDWKSYDILSDAFYWLNQVTRPAQIKGEGNSLHLLMGGDACAHRFRRNNSQAFLPSFYPGIVVSKEGWKRNLKEKLTSTPKEVRSRINTMENWNSDVEHKFE